jgi:drug/metabolite transporter (DMT)-like permease
LSRTAGLVFVLLSTFGWSSTGLFTRLIALDAPTMLFWRCVWGALGLLAVILLIEGRPGLRSFGSLGRPGLAYALVTGIGMATYLWAMVATTAAHVALIYATAPLLAAGLGWLVLREAPGTGALVASLVALAGVATMVGLGVEGRLAGDALALVMTLSMAALIVLARRFPGVPTLQAACASAVVTAALSFPFAIVEVGGREMALLVLFGLVSNALGLGLFIVGARYLPPVETALVSTLEAPLTPLWVWLVVAETPSPATVAGGAIVMTAVLAHILFEARRR